VTEQSSSSPLRLHLGGVALRGGWTIVNVQPGPGVDHVGSCTDLSMFAAASCAEVYASHVLEHLGYDAELPQALREIHRVLAPGGRLMFSVPDLDILCRLFVAPGRSLAEKTLLMRMMFGGRIDAHDVHYSGLTWDFMQFYCERPAFGRPAASRTSACSRMPAGALRRRAKRRSVEVTRSVRRSDCDL
jgi:predicted SAM-dependent methyltransferase